MGTFEPFIPTPIAERRAVLAVVLASYLMILLDTSIVITGLPEIRADLGLSPIGLSWVQNAYTLCFGGFLLLGARMGDLLGRRRVYLTGVAVFTLASLAIGLATTPAVLLGARAVQGMGAAVIAPVTLALLSTHFPEGADRERALAWYAATAGVGASLGLVLGGLFADAISWRVGFLMNVPVGLVLFAVAGRLLRETETATGRLDMAGALASTLGMGALVYGIVRSATAGWHDGATLGGVAAGLTLLALFLVREARAADPLLPLRLFTDRERAGAYAARMLFLGAMVGFFFFTTQFMQGVLGFTPFEAGMGFLPLTVTGFLASLCLPALTRRLGNGRVLALSLGFAMAGMAWLAQARTGSSYLTAVALPMVVIGIGKGTALGPLTVAGVRRVEGRDAGAAAGLVNVAHQLGGTLGLSLLVVVFAAAGSPAASAADALAGQIGSALLCGAAFFALALVVTLGIVLPGEGARRVNAAVCGSAA